jgi:hypothetical protein
MMPPLSWVLSFPVVKNVQARYFQENVRDFIFSGFLHPPFLPSGRFLQDGGDPGDFHDPHSAHGPVPGCEGYAGGGGVFFFADDVQDEGGGDPTGDVYLPPGAGPCRGLPAIRFGTDDHEG